MEVTQRLMQSLGCSNQCTRKLPQQTFYEMCTDAMGLFVELSFRLRDIDINLGKDFI